MSKNIRVFGEIKDDIAEITGDEQAHAAKVLRIKIGDEICVLNNTNYEYLASVEKITKTQIIAKIHTKTLNIKENKRKIILLCGFLKGDKTEFIVQKATELGVFEIVVFDSQNSSAYLSQSKVARLNKVAQEAAKQCGRSKFPKVLGTSFKDALELGNGYKNKLFAYELASGNGFDLKNINGDCAIVVGSEGGFTNDEVLLAKNLGYQVITLGSLILRAETAAITLTAITAFLNGDLGN